MKVKYRCPKCGKENTIINIVNSRKKATRFKKGFVNVAPCIHCNKILCDVMNEVMIITGNKARIQE